MHSSSHNCTAQLAVSWMFCHAQRTPLCPCLIPTTPFVHVDKSLFNLTLTDSLRTDIMFRKSSNVKPPSPSGENVSQILRLKGFSCTKYGPKTNLSDIFWASELYFKERSPITAPGAIKNKRLLLILSLIGLRTFLSSLWPLLEKRPYPY